jgi:hypothetical protein
METHKQLRLTKEVREEKREIGPFFLHLNGIILASRQLNAWLFLLLPFGARMILWRRAVISASDSKNRQSALNQASMVDKLNMIDLPSILTCGLKKSPQAAEVKKEIAKWIGRNLNG